VKRIGEFAEKHTKLVLLDETGFVGVEEFEGITHGFACGLLDCCL
jgi:hypothetical protein